VVAILDATIGAVILLVVRGWCACAPRVGAEVLKASARTRERPTRERGGIELESRDDSRRRPLILNFGLRTAGWPVYRVPG